MAPKLGVSTVCFSASFPKMRKNPYRAAKRLLNPNIELNDTQEAVRMFGLNGFELAHRRGMTGQVRQSVFTVHGPVFAGLKSGLRQALTARSSVHKGIGLVMPLIFGWDFGTTDQLASERGASHIIHAKTVQELRSQRSIFLDPAKRKAVWLIEADWAEWVEGRLPDRGIWRPQDVIHLANKWRMDVLLDTSRTQIMGLALRETLEAYSSRVKAIHLSGAVAGQANDGGLALYPEAATEANRVSYRRSLGEIREFLQMIRSLEIPVIIEVSFTTRRIDSQEAVARSVNFATEALANLGQV